MTLLVSDVATYVRRRLDGEPSLPTVALCNNAGRHLVSSHAWEWLIRPPKTVTLGSGTSEASLPSDLGRIVKLETSGSLLNSVQLTTPAQLLELETSEISFTNVGYYAAVVWKPGIDEALRPVLRLWPSVSSGSDQLTVYYHARWTEVTQDSDRLEIPVFMESLFLEMAFAFAQSYEEHDLGDLSTRLSQLQASPLMYAAMSEDGGLQEELGEMGGGAAAMSYSLQQAATIVGGPS